MQYSQSDGGVAPRYDEGEDIVRQLQANQTGVDDRLHQSQIQLFKDRQLITSGDQIDDEALDVAEGAQEGESSSEGGESDVEGDSDDDSEEGDDEEEEEEGAGPTFKRLPQEQIEVRSLPHSAVVVVIHQALCEQRQVHIEQVCARQVDLC